MPPPTYIPLDKNKSESSKRKQRNSSGENVGGKEIKKQRRRGRFLDDENDNATAFQTDIKKGGNVSRCDEKKKNPSIQNSDSDGFTPTVSATSGSQVEQTAINTRVSPSSSPSSSSSTTSKYVKEDVFKCDNLCEIKFNSAEIEQIQKVYDSIIEAVETQ